MVLIGAANDLFSPIFAKLETMVGVARNAFNRHSRQDLEQLKKLSGEVVPQIAGSIKQVDASVAKKIGNEKAAGLKTQSVLTHLQIIAENLGGLIDPIEQKIKNGVLFSEKAVSQTNYLFDHQAGIMRSLLDILKTDNDMLKRFALDESQKLVQNCIDFATEHEDRLIEGLCLPQAAPLFLAILDRMRTVSQHEVDIVQIMVKT